MHTYDLWRQWDYLCLCLFTVRIFELSMVAVRLSHQFVNTKTSYTSLYYLLKCRVSRWSRSVVGVGRQGEQPETSCRLRKDSCQSRSPDGCTSGRFNLSSHQQTHTGGIEQFTIIIRHRLIRLPSICCIF